MTSTGGIAVAAFSSVPRNPLCFVLRLPSLGSEESAGKVKSPSHATHNPTGVQLTHCSPHPGPRALSPGASPGRGGARVCPVAVAEGSCVAESGGRGWWEQDTKSGLELGRYLTTPPGARPIHGADPWVRGSPEPRCTQGPFPLVRGQSLPCAGPRGGCPDSSPRLLHSPLANNSADVKNGSIFLSNGCPFWKMHRVPKRKNKGTDRSRLWFHPPQTTAPPQGASRHLGQGHQGERPRAQGRALTQAGPPAFLCTVFPWLFRSACTGCRVVTTVWTALSRFLVPSSLGILHHRFA